MAEHVPIEISVPVGIRHLDSFYSGVAQQTAGMIEPRYRFEFGDVKPPGDPDPGLTEFGVRWIGGNSTSKFEINFRDLLDLAAAVQQRIQEVTCRPSPEPEQPHLLACCALCGGTGAQTVSTFGQSVCHDTQACRNRQITQGKLHDE